MTEKQHEEIQELLGAFAIDALDFDEIALVSDHIRTCLKCDAEVIEHQQVASLLGNSGGDAPAELWAKIESRVPKKDDFERRSAPKLFLSSRESFDSTNDGLGTSTGIKELGTSRNRFALRRLVVGIAAALVVIGFLGAQEIRLENQVHSLQQASTPSRQLQSAVAIAESNPSAQKVTLTASGSSSSPLSQIVILPDGESYFTKSKLPGLSPKQTYQLWGIVKGELISLGILGNDPGTVAFQVNPLVHVSEFAVTVEVAGGVVRTTHSPVAQSHLITS